MRRGFTLLELLAVMGIMGLLGGVAVGGYSAMRRAIEERGVMQNVNTALRAAYQRAQIDRQPVVVYLWNETASVDSAANAAVETDLKVYGRLVAVRRFGRFSDVKGTWLIDEFADLERTHAVTTDAGRSSNVTYIYPMDDLSQEKSSTTLRRSAVWDAVVKRDYAGEVFLVRDAMNPGGLPGGTSSGGSSSGGMSANAIPAYAFKVEDAGGVRWTRGMAYGLEFLSLQLPNGFIFGSSYSRSLSAPYAGQGTLVYDVAANALTGISTGGTLGRRTVTVSAVRQKGADYEIEKLATTDDPEREL